MQAYEGNEYYGQQQDVGFGRSFGPKVDLNEFMAKVYGWMTLGLLITGLVSFTIFSSKTLFVLIFGSGLMWPLFIVEILLVGYLAGWIRSMSVTTAMTVFILYSAINGMTLSFIFAVYTKTSIASTFVLCAATFGAMSLYGFTTKSDISSWGSFLLMALLGLIFATMVNIFLASPVVYWISTYIGVLIFVALTAYDTQKLKMMAQGGFRNEASATKLAVWGALDLYLDFINLFLYLLRIFGGRRND